MELEKLDPEDFVIVLISAILFFLHVPLDLMATDHESWPGNSLYIHFLKISNTELYQKAKQGMELPWIVSQLLYKIMEPQIPY